MLSPAPKVNLSLPMIIISSVHIYMQLFIPPPPATLGIAINSIVLNALESVRF